MKTHKMDMEIAMQPANWHGAAVDQATKTPLVAYLRAAMEKTAKDATNLARAIGVVPSTITRPLEPSWEGGMSAATLRKISDYADLPIPDALQDTRKKPYPAGAAASDSQLSEASAAGY